MKRPQPRSTRTDTLFPYTTLFRSHFELYYAISGSGYVLHTVNPRLFPEQIAWIINDAEDQVLFFDLTFAPLVEKLAPQCPTVRHWVAMTDRAHMPSLPVPNLQIGRASCTERVCQYV